MNQNQGLVPSKGFQDFYEEVDKDNLVGSGTYGQVFRYRSRTNKTRVVSVKQSKIDTEKSIPPSIFRELVLLSEINYPHIIHVSSKDIYSDYESKNLSFAYDFGSIDVRKMIQYYAKQNKTIDFRIAKSILFQLLLALDHLHKRSIAHCDITPSNLLLMDPNYSIPGIVKLIDFGLSRVIENSGITKNYGVVTVWYRAPELLFGDTNYDTKIDIWSAGCIFAELLTGSALFATSRSQEEDPLIFNQVQVDAVINVLGRINENDLPSTCTHKNQLHNWADSRGSNLNQWVKNANPSALDLLNKMLCYNPAHRISAHDALRHPFFNEEPICVMNISGHIPPEEWKVLAKIGSTTKES